MSYILYLSIFFSFGTEVKAGSSRRRAAWPHADRGSWQGPPGEKPKSLKSREFPAVGGIAARCPGKLAGPPWKEVEKQIIFQAAHLQQPHLSSVHSLLLLFSFCSFHPVTSPVVSRLWRCLCNGSFKSDWRERTAKAQN